MTDINLDDMGYNELLQLQKDVGKAVDTFEKRRKAAAREEARQAALKMGFTLEELLGDKASKGSKRTKTGLPPAYRNPENPEQTWSGRGRRPFWMNEALEQGHEMEEFAI